MTIKSAVKVAIAIVTILLMLPVLGDFPILRSMWFAVFFIWLAIVAYVYIGGIDELYIGVGHGYVEILRAKFVTTKVHRDVLISTKAENITSVRYRRFAMWRRLDIKYKEPGDSHERCAKVGLTMMERKKRRELVRTMYEIWKNNSNENKTTRE